MKEKGVAPVLIFILVVGLIGAGIGAYVITQGGQKGSQQPEGPTEENTQEEGGGETKNPPTISTPSESEESYKTSCRSDITFGQLDANPYTYKGERVTYQGTVLQVLEYYEETYYRIDIDSGDTIYVTYGGTTNIVKGDAIQIWGEVLGSYTYTSRAGWEITLPSIGAAYIEKPQFNLTIGETAKWKHWKISVKSVEENSGYISKYAMEWASEGKVFLILDVKVKNVGTEERYAYSGDFWLVDSNGNKFEYDSRTYSLDGGFESVDLYQNQKTEGKILFEIPEDATGLRVQFNLGTSYEPLLATWQIPSSTSG